MWEDYLKKVYAVAKYRYDLDSEIIAFGYSDLVHSCYEQGFPPRRTVEIIAEQIF